MRLLDGECRRAVSKYTEMEARNPYLNPLVFQVQFLLRFLHFLISFSQGFGSVPVFIWYGSGTSILGWISIRIQFFWIKNNSLPFPRAPIRIHPSYRRSLQPSKANIQHFKTWNFLIFVYFCGSFLPSRIRIPNTDPGPIRIRIRYPAFSNIILNLIHHYECRVPYNLAESACVYSGLVKVGSLVFHLRV